MPARITQEHRQRPYLQQASKRGSVADAYHLRHTCIMHNKQGILGINNKNRQYLCWWRNNGRAYVRAHAPLIYLTSSSHDEPFRADLEKHLTTFVTQHRIRMIMPTGGYVTMTGQAGQGKSSLMAALVKRAKVEQHTNLIASHFIPLTPPDTPRWMHGLFEGLVVSARDQRKPGQVAPDQGAHQQKPVRVPAHGHHECC